VLLARKTNTRRTEGFSRAKSGSASCGHFVTARVGVFHNAFGSWQGMIGQNRPPVNAGSTRAALLVRWLLYVGQWSHGVSPCMLKQRCRAALQCDDERLRTMHDGE